MGFDHRTYTGLGKQTLGGHKQNLVHTRTQEKGSDPTRDRSRLSRECSGVSGGGVGQRWPAAGLGTLNEAVPAQDLLKEVTIIFITPTIVWPQVKQQGREHSPTHHQKIGLKIY